MFFFFVCTQAIDSNVFKTVFRRYIYNQDPVQVGIGPIDKMTNYDVLRQRFQR